MEQNEITFFWFHLKAPFQNRDGYDFPSSDLQKPL